MEKFIKFFHAAVTELQSKDDTKTIAQKLMTAAEITPAHQEMIEKGVLILTEVLAIIQARSAAAATPAPTTETPGATGEIPFDGEITKNEKVPQ